MKEIFESILGVFFLTILMAGSLSCISASIDAKNADASKTAYIAEMENSNFSSDVVQKIFEQAELDGYDVSMKLYHRQDSVGDSITIANSSADVGNTSDVYMARMELTFSYSFKFLNNVTQHRLLGYAR